MASYDQHVLVAAIDFGTTFSGYALSFRDTPEQIRINKNWGEGLGFQSHQTPTAVLTDKSGDFLAFGYDAEQQYSEAIGEDGECTDLQLFRNFKMMLYNTKDVKRRALTSSVDGTIFPAIEVFAQALSFLKNHLLKALKTETGRDVDDELIRWVVTVPAIWSDEAKQFMREAALKANLIRSKYSSQLVIALEPEAASLFCRRLEMAEYTNPETIDFPVGTKYLVLDCGGGTIDITAHEMRTNNKVQEITSASGGPWGGTEVDKNFINLLGSILGVNFMNTFKSECPSEWLTFTTNFEKLKKSFKPNGKSKISLPLMWSMCNLFSKVNKGQPIEEAIKRASDKGVAFASGTLVIKYDAALKLFQPVIQKILDHLKWLRGNPKLGDLDYIFMIGGFSECEVLQQAVKDATQETKLRVLIPSSAQLAVVKGAVLYGHMPEEIQSRRAKYTYGVKVFFPFDHNIHDKKYKYMSDGEEWCEHIFSVLIAKDEEIEIGAKKVIKRKGYEYRKGTRFGTKILRMSDKPNKPVQYSDDPRVSIVGLLPLDTIFTKPKSGHLTPPYTEIVEFGGTEMVCTVIDESTGKRITESINFFIE